MLKGGSGMPKKKIVHASQKDHVFDFQNGAIQGPKKMSGSGTALVRRSTPDGGVDDGDDLYPQPQMVASAYRRIRKALVLWAGGRSAETLARTAPPGVQAREPLVPYRNGAAPRAQGSASFELRGSPCSA